MMDFKTAESIAKRMAREGNFKGITKLVERLRKEGMHPTVLQMIGTYAESAMLNIGGQKSNKPWYLD